MREEGWRVAHAHLRYLNPFPSNLGDIVSAYPRVLVPEVNLGQLLKLVRAEFLVDAQGLNKVDGLPFRRVDIRRGIISQLELAGHHHGNGAGNGASKEE